MTDGADNRGKRGDGWLRVAMWTVIAGLLLTPFIAMQFSDEVNWTVSDFVFAGVMLIGPGLIYELVLRRVRSLAYRFGVAFALAATILLVWVTGAVGIIGSEDNNANLMFLGVIVAAAVGVAVSHLRAAGMQAAMLVAAAAQALVGVVAFAGKMGATDGIWPRDIVFATVFFGVLWLISATLFGAAARTDKIDA